jgi:sortase A
MEKRYIARLKNLSILLGITLLSFVFATLPYWREQAAYLTEYNVPASEMSRSGPVMEPNILLIESLRIRAPIISVDRRDETTFQEALMRGVVHYPGTASIGEFGNAYIFGHSSDYVWARGDYKSVFALLPRMERGDVIVASNGQGERFTYRVIETLVVDANDARYLDQMDYRRKLLTLQTSYPVGTALRRFLVIAEAED